jgi:hypothetical protein
VLTEDQVTEAVCEHLRAHHWTIVSRAMGKTPGVDVVAERQEARLEIEAKGAGSSDLGSSRYGHSFTRGNVFTHVGEAVLKALRVIAADRAHAAIAFPDNHDHRAEVELVRPALQRLGIIVFWVQEDGTVQTGGTNMLWLSC